MEQPPLALRQTRRNKKNKTKKHVQAHSCSRSARVWNRSPLRLGPVEGITERQLRWWFEGCRYRAVTCCVQQGLRAVVVRCHHANTALKHMVTVCKRSGADLACRFKAADSRSNPHVHQMFDIVGHSGSLFLGKRSILFSSLGWSGFLDLAH